MKTKIPEGWQEVELGEVCELITDGTHDKTPLVSKEDGIPLVTSKDLTENGVSFKNVLYISREQHQQIIKRSKPERGDILYSKIGTIGKPTIVNVDFEFSIKNVALFKLKKEIINKFLVYYLKYPQIHNSLNEAAGGGNQKFIPLNKLEKIPILLPPLSLQKKIVSILEKAEKLKQKREDADKLTNEYLKSVFHEMFLEHIEGKVEELNSLCTEITDGSHRTPKLLEEGYPFLTVANMGEKDFVYEDVKKISRGEYLDLVKNGCRPEKGDVLFSKDGTVGKAMRINQTKEQVVLSSIAILKPDFKKITSIYLEYALKTDFALNQAIERKSGSAIRRIILRQLKQVKIPLPPLPLQQKFAKIVEHVEKLKEKQKKSGENINELFDALMSKAFKGEL